MLLSTHLKSSRFRRAVNRAAAFVVLALQVAVGASALWEPLPGVKLGVHAEQGGTRHADQHAEESCVVCAVRAQASHTAPTAPTILAAVASAPPQAREIHATVDPRAVSTRSRAPPVALEV
jgi:hypothetical protein